MFVFISQIFSVFDILLLIQSLVDIVMGCDEHLLHELMLIVCEEFILILCVTGSFHILFKPKLQKFYFFWRRPLSSCTDTLPFLSASTSLNSITMFCLVDGTSCFSTSHTHRLNKATPKIKIANPFISAIYQLITKSDTKNDYS